MVDLIRRKDEHFPEIRRLILDWDVVRTSGGFHLNVVSTLAGHAGAGADERSGGDRWKNSFNRNHKCIGKNDSLTPILRNC